MRNFKITPLSSNSRVNRSSHEVVLVTGQLINIPIKHLIDSSVEWVELKVRGELRVKQANLSVLLSEKVLISPKDLADSLIVQGNTYSEELDDRSLTINLLDKQQNLIVSYGLYFTVLRICLDVDADRDGVVEENNPNKGNWKQGKDGYGAILLVNSDRDRPEAHEEDYHLKGLLEIKDCSLMVVRKVGPKRLPSQYDLRVWVSEENAPYLRIFDQLETNYGHELVGHGHQQGNLIKQDITKDIFLAVEGLHYRDIDFDGIIFINLSLVKDNEILYTDRVRFQVAPWIMTPHTLSPQTVYIARIASGSNYKMIEQMRFVVGASKAQLEVVSSIRYRNDRWMQDEIEFGYSESPGHFMYVVLNSPRDRGLDEFPEEELLGIDVGHITRKNPEATTLDSFGNLEVSPPVTVDGVDYPFGRILFGGNHSDAPEYSTRMVKNIRDFLYAQKIQPPIELFCDWLEVGHIDEFMTFVPTKTAKGFKLILTSPNKYYEIIQALKEQHQTELTQRTRIGDMSITDLLSNQELLQDNQRFQRYIDWNRDILKQKLGLREDDIIDIPGLFQGAGHQKRAETFFPNMVNMLVLDNHLAIPKPFGPKINEECQIEACVKNLLEPFGCTCYFIDNWEPYFLGRGEIHCGTNTRRKPFQTKWWEIASDLTEHQQPNNY
ncbi:protein-arginine deiminase family protein [Crocosphaera subtropica]|nr:protein-arginine deiminase family protein [Crocosphaera subtropica]